jgi:hypothetical protein
MNISIEVIDTGEALKSHTLGDLLARFTKNVDTENMPSWDIVWRGYHYAVNINNLRNK